MKTLYLAILLIIPSIASPVRADDQEKAIKQTRMITALSRDETARGIISRAFADVFKVPRLQLVQERKSLSLNYGALFLAHELVLNGATIDQIAVQLRAKMNVTEIARSTGADWKKIAADAKKMNSRINEGIYKHFLHDSADKQRDQAEHYVVSADFIGADKESTLDELVKARDTYIFWRNLAAPANGGQADRDSVLGQAYQQSREAIEDSHGATSSATAVVH